uniref:Uridine 5'-monophosphate synthase n=1 Tax=Euglena gracilis TaxID=3039 RepID=Q5H7T3_EUGGR|nr:orotate phosphoribosyltransferase and orotidine-5'-monophosphate decarboxylase [Euglena gracilis]|eukprot:EG_transcript_9327
MDMDGLILRLFDIQAVKFGSFKLKSGITSPIYLDLRVIVSFPDVLAAVAALMWERVKDLQWDHLCGVPYTALPIATVIAVQQSRSMVMRRKEKKEYGTSVLVEGRYTAGQTVLIVEDIITSGASILETAQDLRAAGLQPLHSIVMINREQGGQANIEASGCSVHSVLTLSQVLECLERHQRLEPAVVGQVRQFLAANAQVAVPASPLPPPRPKALPFAQRAALCPNPVGRRLFEIMEQKKSNLSFNPDVTKKAEILRLTDLVGPSICMLKTHIDVVEDFDWDLVEQLRALAVKHNFVIFEDRKFADIGNTVQLQFTSGVYRIAEWADIVNAHLVPGPGIIDGLRQGAKAAGRDIGLLLLAEMSSKGNLATGAYTEANVKAALEHPDFVIGFIAMQGLAPAHPNLMYITPGVQLAKGGDALGQQYDTPEAVVGRKGSDIIQVGRGIFGAADPAAEAEKYRVAAWEAYQARVQATA